MEYFPLPFTPPTRAGDILRGRQMSEKILRFGTAGTQHYICLLFTTKNVTDMFQIQKKGGDPERMNKGGDEVKIGVPVLRSPVFQKPMP
jgi:hypothetical protein